MVAKHKSAFAVGGPILSLLVLQSSAQIAALPKPIRVPLPNNSTETKKKPKDRYFIVTVEGTSPEAYQKFIRSLPDGGAGQQRYYDWPRLYQTYLAEMTEMEAHTANQNPIVDMIGSNTVRTYLSSSLVTHNGRKPSYSHSRVQMNETKLGTRSSAPTWVLERRSESDLHLRMLSDHPLNRLASLEHTMSDAQYNYLHENSSGRGVMVYVLDSGFDFKHPVSLVR